ncbi:MAG: glycine betaine ABC transporter substrate-binding protein [Thermodesulfobacteriota bacterium]|nr:glycine betaine ABC transporter substrate-binding protein [Thermodesulfobacteriota bacterium]
MKRVPFVLILALMSFLFLANPLHSCVGRLLVVAVDNSQDQVIIGQMLSILINERTGTTVDIVKPGDLKTCHEAVLKGEADIYVNYIGDGLVLTGASSGGDDPQKVYTLVSQAFLEKFEMVWLKPFGFQGPMASEANPAKKKSGTLAAPVTTRDVLRKFPVLDRLINKLGGRVDNSIMEELRKKAEGQEVKEVVREFLKAHRLI